MKTIIIAYLIIINVVAFIMYGVDKKRAIKHEWRISEAALFIVALLAGGLGAYGGMQVFRHKTKKWYFQIGIPLILLGEGYLIGRFLFPLIL